MMDKAKMDIVMATLKAQGGKCTFALLFEEAEKAHCDVLSAALKSMKKVLREQPIASTGLCIIAPRSPADHHGSLPVWCRTR